MKSVHILFIVTVALCSHSIWQNETYAAVASKSGQQSVSQQSSEYTRTELMAAIAAEGPVAVDCDTLQTPDKPTSDQCQQARTCFFQKNKACYDDLKKKEPRTETAIQKQMAMALMEAASAKTNCQACESLRSYLQSKCSFNDLGECYRWKKDTPKVDCIKKFEECKSGSWQSCSEQYPHGTPNRFTKILECMNAIDKQCREQHLNGCYENAGEAQQ